MKSTTILSTTALVTSALASPPSHAVADLLVRAMDPATMDPTKLSVLSVLKTAIPTASGTDIVLPTGNAMPQWYKDLPADVMVLLAQMYPETAAVAATGSASTTVSEPILASVSATAESVKETASAALSLTTLTMTMSAVPTDTAESNGTNPTTVSASATGSASASATGSSSTISSTGAGTRSIALGLAVAVAFCFFA